MVRFVVWRFDRIDVLVQAGFPLRRLAGDEAIEVVEPVPGRPAVERPHGGGLVAGELCHLPKAAVL